MYGLYSGNKPYGDGVERDSGPLDLIFRLAGSGRGPAGQVRLWSAIVLVLFGGMTIGRLMPRDRRRDRSSCTGDT